MVATEVWLPDLVLLETCNGNWGDYLETIYSFFKHDFVNSKPSFPGKPVGLKRYPLSEGKECTFWHFIQEGSVEDNRIPDLRRCERIRWPRPLIEAVNSNRVRVWNTMRRTHRRIVIALDDFSYVVVLEDRVKYVLPWTAYTVDREHRRRKLEKEYLSAKKTDAAS